MLSLALSVIIGTVIVGTAQEQPQDGLALVLEDSITAHIQMIDCPGVSYATVSIRDGADSNAKILRNVGDLSYVSKDGSTVIFSVELAVKEISSTIVVEAKDSAGNVIRTYKPSVLSFLDSITQDPSANSGIKATAQALKTYGALAKTYFSGQSATPAGNVSFGASAATKSGYVDGISHAGSSLVLVSETTLRHYFKLDAGRSIDSYTFYVDYDMDGGYDEVCDYGHHETERLEPVQSGSYYYVDITGIAPNDLDRQYTVCVTDGASTYSCSYSAMNYAAVAYKNSSSTPALKALLESLKGYLDGASKMSASIIYKDDNKTLKTVAYQYGVDNYLDYTPTKSGYTFAGWYTDIALTQKANVIEAGTTGNITLYAKFVKYNFLISNPDTLNNTIQSTSGTLTDLICQTSADGTVTYSNYSGGNASTGTVMLPIDKTNGSNMLTTLQNLEGHSKLFKITLEVGKEPGQYVLPFAMNGGKGWYINIPGIADPIDGKYYVYMNNNVENQKLAVLPEDGSLVTVTVYIDFSKVDVNNYAEEVKCVDIYAVNMAGKVITATLSTRDYNNWAGGYFGRTYIGAQTTTVDKTFVPDGYPASIKIGDFLMEAVDADETPFSNYVVDSYGNTVMEYTPFKATRLPETYSLADNTTLKFAGWYADVECTKPINSIPAGSSGPITVYPKWVAADMTASDETLATDTKALLSAFSGKSYGSLPSFSTYYNNIPAINQSHPRVYVNSATLENVIENFTCADNERVYSALLYEADRGLSADSADLETSVNYAESLALAYLITGKQAYGYKAIYYVLSFIEQMRSVSSYDDYDASSALHVFGEVYDWCYSLLTSEQKTQIINGACNYVAKHSKAGVPPSITETVVGHGTEQLFMRDWVAFAIAVADEAPSIYKYVAGRLVNEYVKTPNWYYQSGVQHQGSAYGTVARLYPNIAADMMMYAATGERIFTVDLANVVLTHINRVRPDDESIRIGDDFNQVGSFYGMTQLAKVAFFAGNYYGSSVAKTWYEYLGAYFDPTAAELSKAMFVIMNNPSVKLNASPYEGLELVHTTKYPSSSVVARSAWGDPSAWLTYTNIEEAGTNNHDHKDSGTFQIYYKGILAPDTGMYEYNGTDYNASYRSTYALQTISKNGLLIYNPNLYSYNSNYLYTGGQRSESQADFSGSYTLDQFLNTNNANRATLLGESNGLNADGSFKYAYISGDITKAYNDQTVDLVMRSTMTVATGDPEHPMAFIVYDRITSDNASYKKSFLLHTMEKPTFNGGTETSDTDSYKKVTGATSFYYTNTLGPSGAYAQDDLNDKYNGKLTTQTLLPENPTYRYIGGDGYRFWIPTTRPNSYSSKNAHNAITENNTKHPVGEVGWGRVEISPSTQNKTDSFLNVMYVGDAKDANGNTTSNTLIPSTLVQSTTHEGAVSFGNVVMFSKTNTPVSGTVEFTADGSGEMTYYVTGLASGSWIIKVDGVTHDDYIVEAGSGLLTFKAEAGKRITLTKGSVQRYEIGYETNGGIINDATYTTEFAAGDAITIPSNVTKPGCKFDGWYTDAAFTTAANAQTISTSGASITLYAKFTPAVYINYVTNGGNITDSAYTTQFYPGDTVTLPSNVTKSGHKFAGWYFDAAFLSAANAQSVAGKTETVNLYAKFDSAYTITYQANGGTINDSSYTTAFFTGDSITLPSNVTKSGYLFAGWYLDQGLNTAANASGITASVTLYAKWNSVGGSIIYMVDGSVASSVHFAGTEDAYLGYTPDPKTTHAFAGWYADSACTVKASPVIPAGTNTDVTVYAKWEPVAAHDIAALDGNTLQKAIMAWQFSGTGYTAVTDNLYYTGGYAHPSITFVDPTGNGNTVKTNVNDSYAVLKVDNNSGFGVTLQNQLDGTPGGTKVFKLTLELASVAEMNVMPFALYNTDYDSTNGRVITVTGKDKYVYLGALEDGNRIAELKDGVLTKFEIYCDFTDPDSVVYTAKNIDGVTRTVTLGNKLGATHSKGGYFMVQLGIDTVGSKGDTSVFRHQANSALQMGKFHMTAVPQPISKIVDGDGNFIMDYEIFESATLPETYGNGSSEFLGWYADPEFNTPITSISKGNSGIVTVYPKFAGSIVGAKITYMVDGVAENIVTCDASVDTYHSYAPLEKDGYTFAGWYADAAFTTKASPVIPAGSTEDVTVYAKFVHTQLTKSSMALHDALIARFTGTSGFSYDDKRTTDGYVEYKFAYGVSETLIDIPYHSTTNGDYWGMLTHFSDKKMADGYYSGSSKYIYKTSLEMALGSSGVPIRYYVNGHSGGAIYLENNASGAPKIYGFNGSEYGTLTSDLTTFDAFIDWSAYDLTVKAGYKKGDVYVNTANGVKIKLEAVPLDLGAANAGNFLFTTTSGECSLRIGEFTVGVGNTNTIVDPDGNIIMEYTMFEEATLPTTYNGSAVEWYSDAELTQRITGITKGNSGVVTVYPKLG